MGPHPLTPSLPTRTHTHTHRAASYNKHIHPTQGSILRTHTHIHTGPHSTSHTSSAGCPTSSFWARSWGSSSCLRCVVVSYEATEATAGPLPLKEQPSSVRTGRGREPTSHQMKFKGRLNVASTEKPHRTDGCRIRGDRETRTQEGEKVNRTCEMHGKGRSDIICRLYETVKLPLNAFAHCILRMQHAVQPVSDMLSRIHTVD